MFTAFHVHYHGRHCGIEGFVMRGEAIPPTGPSLSRWSIHWRSATRQLDLKRGGNRRFFHFATQRRASCPCCAAQTAGITHASRAIFVFYLIGRSMKAAFGRNYRLCADGQMIIGCPTCRRFIDERLIRVGIRTLCLASQ
jgi:hypothetical protein